MDLGELDLPGIDGKPLYLLGIAVSYGYASHDSRDLPPFRPLAFARQASTGRWRRGVKITAEHYDLTVAGPDRVELLDTPDALLFRVRCPATPQGQIAAARAAHPDCAASIVWHDKGAPAGRVLHADLIEIGMTYDPAFPLTAVWRSDAPGPHPAHVRAAITAMHLADMAATAATAADHRRPSAPPAPAARHAAPAARNQGRPWQMKAAAGTGEIFLYEDIGAGMSPRQFAQDLQDLGNVATLHIYMNSPGGSVFDGLTIYNQLKRHKARKIVHVDGLAASIASVIAMAGNEIVIANNGMMMIQDPLGLEVGRAAELRAMADVLDKTRDTILGVYVERTTTAEAQLSEWMTAETWFTAQEAVAAGLADRAGQAVPAAAMAKHDRRKFSRHTRPQAARHLAAARPRR